MNGTIKNIPQSPYITDGMAARISIREESKFEKCLFMYSSIKIAVPIDIGDDINTANIDVINVPTIKGRAPKISLTGFHLEYIRNEKPKDLIEGSEFINNSIKNPTTITINREANIYKVISKILSATLLLAIFL